MANVHGSPGDAPQMPAAPNAGPAPAPYGGPDLSPLPPDYSVDITVSNGVQGILDGVPAVPGVAESAAATSIPAGLADAPYAPGSTDPIYAGGDADAGGRDNVGGSVAEAVANQFARWRELESDTFGQGSVIGDLVTFPPSPLDPGAGVGNTAPYAGFYDPPREYGGTQGPPGYQGEAI